MKKIVLSMAIAATLYTSKAEETRQLAVDKPVAVADLRTTTGAALVNASWYIQPAWPQDVEFKAPGPSVNDPLPLYPTGTVIKTQRLQPQIGNPDFESGFISIPPADLDKRQGSGLFSFVWYKT